MFGSTTLDVVIWLIFIYLLLGLVCTVVYEVIASALNLRAKDLERGIHALLKDPALVERFYSHPIISTLQINKQQPAYIPSRSFALALLDIAAASDSNQYSGSAGGSTQYSASASSFSSNRFNDIRPALYSLPDDGATGELKRVLLIMADEAEGNINRVRNSIEIWFSSAMDRVSGMYKQRAMTMILVLALLFTFAANVDTIGIAKRIWINPILRDALATEAQRRARESVAAESLDRRLSPAPYPSEPLANTLTPTPTPTPTPRAMPSPSFPVYAEERLGVRSIPEELGLPIGWSSFAMSQLTPPRLFTLILGWLITALVVSFCATLWFDMLNKFILVRSTVKPREQYIEQPVADQAPPNTPQSMNY
ncbi:MAG: hypothetical protein WCB68_10605 [Pyrinomonadaceae bacterium]